MHADPSRAHAPAGVGAPALDLAATARAAFAEPSRLADPRREGRFALYPVMGPDASARPFAPGPSADGRPACVCVLGAFDGVHRGHRALIDAARRDARRRGLPVVAVTFDPDPSCVVGGGKAQPALLSCAERRRFLATAGVDAILSYDFTPELARVPYGAFFEMLLADAAPASVHVGEGFRLGARGEGTLGRLQGLGESAGVPVVGHPLLSLDGAPVSATRIRGLVEAGAADEAARLLGRPPTVEGSVRHGRGEGASFGFPTANVVVAPGLCCPASGVFAGIVRLGGEVWPAAVNAGLPPTFEEASREAAVLSDKPAGFLEAALLGFSGDLYGETVEVAFVEPLRASRPFSSLEGLKETVMENIRQTGRLLGTQGAPL